MRLQAKIERTIVEDRLNFLNVRLQICRQTKGCVILGSQSWTFAGAKPLEGEEISTQDAAEDGSKKETKS